MPRRRRADKQQWCARVAYDGGRFRGVQVQPGHATVLGTLRARLAGVGVAAPWAVSAAARTDAGVHADANLLSWRQIAAADPDAQRRALLRPVGDGLTLWDVAVLPQRALARCMAASKHYRYLVVDARGCPSRTPAPAVDNDGPSPAARAWAVPVALDVAAMRVAAAACCGRHDFAALRARSCGQQTTVRTLHALDVARVAPDIVAIDLRGDAFLRRMARLVVATLVAIGAGERPVALMAAALAGAAVPPPAAPAHGLTLVALTLQPRWRAAIEGAAARCPAAIPAP